MSIESVDLTASEEHKIMKKSTSEEANEARWQLPHLGQRIIKTTIAVFICLVIYALLGYEGDTMPTEAAITAIICMQQDIHDTRKFAFNRFSGTMIGTFWGILMILALAAFPALGKHQLLLYALMAAGVMLSLYTTVALRLTEASNLSAIIFLCIVIAYPDISSPLHGAALRVLDVFLGTIVAICVNVFRLPRRKNDESVFFIRSRDLVPDRFAQVSPAILYRLNYLYGNGAKICIMSEHAPAFFTVQMSSVRLSVPLIVMDGAAIYDANENIYLQSENLSEEDSHILRKSMDLLGISYFIYTIHNNRTCIFHHGQITAAEQEVYDRMKRSPYRHYLEGEVFDPAEIVYLKIIGDEKTIDDAQARLQHVLAKETLRVKRSLQAGTNGVTGLYIYSAAATMEQAKKRLMEMLWEKDPMLSPVDFWLPHGYSSEHDAIHLLHRLENEYEPLLIMGGTRFRDR